MAAGYESRRFIRVTVDLPITLESSTGETLEARIVDLSMRGILARGSAPASLGATFTATFAADPLKPVHVRVTAVRASGNELGLEITAIKEESLENFREIVVSHAEDSFECDEQIVVNAESLPELY